MSKRLDEVLLQVAGLSDEIEDRLVDPNYASDEEIAATFDRLTGRR